MNNLLIKKISFCVVMAFLLIASMLGFGGMGIFKNGMNKAYASWMSSIDDNTSLRDINMPGSHDTMALFSFGGLAGKCQNLTLEEQLNLGIRFLDIRLQLVDNNLIAVHGIVNQKNDFERIAVIARRFLAKNPSEFIIMSIKEEEAAKNSSITFEECILNDLKDVEAEEYFVTDTTIPEKIGDVRGKVILLSRYRDSTIGIPAFSGWTDSRSFTLGNDIFVQDKYRITSKEEKQDEIINCFNEAGHALKINFLSAYRTNAFPSSYAPSAAKDINPWINKEIGNYNDRNIVLYDFVNKENMDAFFKGVL